MRIIRILVVLLMLGAIFAPHAMAAETAEPNETQTKFKIQENILVESNIIKNTSNILAFAPQKNSGDKSEKNEEEAKRDSVLNKWKEKQVYLWNSLPKEQFTINASAYTAAADECGNSKGITASGLKVKEKETIACPPQFPFGVKIQIDGMGTYVCEDRGGAIKGNHVDIYVQTKSEAFAFGRRNLTAQVVLD